MTNVLLRWTYAKLRSQFNTVDVHKRASYTLADDVAQYTAAHLYMRETRQKHIICIRRILTVTKASWKDKPQQRPQKRKYWIKWAVIKITTTQRNEKEKKTETKYKAAQRARARNVYSTHTISILCSLNEWRRACSVAFRSYRRTIFVSVNQLNGPSGTLGTFEPTIIFAINRQTQAQLVTTSPNSNLLTITHAHDNVWRTVIG